MTTLSMRNRDEYGSTSEATRLITIRTNPRASKPRRGRTSSQTRGQTARSFGRGEAAGTAGFGRAGEDMVSYWIVRWLRPSQFRFQPGNGCSRTGPYPVYLLEAGEGRRPRRNRGQRRCRPTRGRYNFRLATVLTRRVAAGWNSHSIRRSVCRLGNPSEAVKRRRTKPGAAC